MSDIDVLDAVMRWFHVVGAIVALGGSIFALFVVLPSVKGVQDETERQRLHENIRRRYARVFLFGVGALLITGLYNYLVVTRPAHQGQPIYHALLGVKFIFALGVFFIGSALLGKAKAFEGIRQQRKAWLMRSVFLALIVVALGTVLGKLPVAAG